METTISNKVKLFEKLHKVMEAISYIEKDKKNTFHNYKYASEEAIKRAVHAELVKNKLLFSLSCSELTRTETTSDKGKKTFITDMRFQYAFTCVETGQSIEGYAYGTGDDASDKGTYKAITGAIKYILTSTFLIPTGDDPETEKDEPKAEVKQEPKASSGKITPNAKADEKKELPWMTDKVCEVYKARIARGEKVGDEIKLTYRLNNQHMKELSDAYDKYNAKNKEVAA